MLSDDLQATREIRVRLTERTSRVWRGLATATWLSTCCAATAMAQANEVQADTTLSEARSAELACYLVSISQLRSMLESDPSAVVLVDERLLAEGLRIPDDCAADPMRPSWILRIEMITPPTAGERYGASAEHGAIRVITKDE